MKARLPQGMGGGAQNMQNMIKQAQKMQAEITNVQEEIENETFTATTGGGAVEITMNGRKQVQSLNISPKSLTRTMLRCSRIFLSALSTSA